MLCGNLLKIWAICQLLICAGLAQTNKEALKKGKEMVAAFKESTFIEDSQKKLEDAGLLQTTEKSEKAKAELKAGKLNLFTAFNGADFTAENGGELATAIASGISKGLGNLVKGYKTKQPYYILSGALNILTSLTTVMGPYGAIAGAILTILSSILDVFGKPYEESQEGMIKRLLEEMSLKELQAESNGMRLFYSTLQEQIELLREAKNPEVSQIELEELHLLSYENFLVFGRIEEKINEDCFPGDVATSDKKTEKEPKVKRCMKLLKLYCQLSLTRQLLLAQLAALARERRFKLLEKSSLNLIKQTQVTDQKVLKFLTRPLESVDARYVIYKLYTKQEDNPIVVSYIKRLDLKNDLEVKISKDVQIEVGFDKDNAMFCNMKHLQGNCRLMVKKDTTATDEKTEQQPVYWGDITQSIFVPPGLKVTAKVLPNLFEKLLTEKKVVTLGPMRGLAVYSAGELRKATELAVLPDTENIDGVTICRGEDDDWCQKLEADVQLKNLAILGGRDFTSPTSILIPEGFEVHLVKDNIVVGPIYGRQVLKKLCEPPYKSISVNVVAKKGGAAADRVVVCDEEKFGGYCQQLDERFITDSYEKSVKFNSLKQISGDYKGREICGVAEVQSMKVPASYKVFLYDSSMVLNGPWEGPLEMPKLRAKGIDSAAILITKGKGGSRKRARIHRRHRGLYNGTDTASFSKIMLGEDNLI